MNPLQRFTRFLLVGAMGMALQLTAVAVLHCLMPTHNLWTTAIALELTLLYNFTWHLHYTWRDRPDSRLRQCLRFHLSNGLLSLLGNVTIVAIRYEPRTYVSCSQTSSPSPPAPSPTSA